jgi:hypothetical protein
MCICVYVMCSDIKKWKNYFMLLLAIKYGCTCIINYIDINIYVLMHKEMIGLFVMFLLTIGLY